MAKDKTMRIGDLEVGDVFVWQAEAGGDDETEQMQVARVLDRGADQDDTLALLLATANVASEEVGDEVTFNTCLRLSMGAAAPGALRRGAKRAGKVLGPALLDGAYRAAATKIVKLLVAAVRQAARASKSKNAAMVAFQKHIATDAGLAAVALIAGTALPLLPVVGQDARALRLAHELLTQGVATGADVVLSGAWSGAYSTLLKALPAIQKTIAALPAAEAA